MQKLSIDIWSDIACPWCYVGKRRLEAALAKFPHAKDVEITWHSFELDKNAPKEREAGVSYAARLASKYGRTVAQAEEMIARMTAVGRDDGIDFHFERVRAGNTFDAHRVIHFARTRGLQGEMKERLLRAYMTEGESIGDHETLVRLGTEIGLDAGELRRVLTNGEFASDVRGDEGDAQEIGIQGVPFFVLAKRLAVSGAQPAELLVSALEKAWTEVNPEAPLAEGAVCGPDGCA